MADSVTAQDRRTVIYDCLSHSRRRYALQCLHEAGMPLALADLAKDVTACESEVPKSEISAETVQDVYVNIYHVHIPKLAEVGLVTYEQERKVVELVDDPTEQELNADSRSISADQ